MSATPAKKELLQDRNPAWATFRPFFLGATAACTATVCVQPIDMVKVQIQLQQGNVGKVVTNPVEMAGILIRKYGFFSLYKGLSAGLFRQLTYGMTRLGIFRTLTNKYTPQGGTAADIDPWTRVALSLAAGGIGALVGTPADAALVRMQNDLALPEAERRGYKNVVDALLRMAKEEGIGGFFKGATPTVVRGLAINVGMLTTFDPLKKALGPSLGGKDSQLTRFGCGFLSGWCAATVSLPFDMLKTRIQKAKPDPSTGKTPGLLAMTSTVIKEEGVMALYQGYPTFVIRITPHIMLTWVFMEWYGQWMKNAGF